VRDARTPRWHFLTDDKSAPLDAQQLDAAVAVLLLDLINFPHPDTESLCPLALARPPEPSDFSPSAPPMQFDPPADPTVRGTIEPGPPAGTRPAGPPCSSAGTPS
jgi:hypothetical protein